MMLESYESAVSTQTPDWTGMIQVSSLFHDEQLDLVRQVQTLAEYGAHVLYPSIEAAGDNEIGLSFYVTVETAIRVNLSLINRPGVSQDEMQFRKNLNAFLKDRQASAH